MDIVPQAPHCNLCGSSDASLYQETGDASKVLRCNGCGLVYVSPQPRIENDHYGEEYYSEWQESQAARRAGMWKRRLRDVRMYRKSGVLLDVGCGLGTFLLQARDAGFMVQGTEVSTYAARKISDQHGITVHAGDLATMSLEENLFDVITFWHSLEHTTDPRANLRKAFNLLKPGGLVVVAVPNLNNRIMQVLYRIVRRRPLRLYTGDARELHLFHFTEETLASMLQRVGFRLERVTLDLGQVVWSKKLIEGVAVVLHALTRRNFSEALRVYASKPAAV